ncbi:MAG TPA: sensor histidine kinase [Pilimelia sp.]|nr:sensor histidine kinase [Pilimelia sp.]
MGRQWGRWPAAARARLRARPLAADTLFALSLVALEAVLLVFAAVQPETTPVPQALAWSAVCAIPVALRRTPPWLAVGATVAMLAVQVNFDQYRLTHVLSFVVVTYTVASRQSVRWAIAGALSMWLPTLAVSVVDEQARAAAGVSVLALILNNLLIALVSFFVGRTVHGRRVSTRVLEERALAAEANQRVLAERAVADERRRIARELHDVVAHHVSVMGVLATGARRVLRRTPDAADEALGTIEDTSRTVLREMRRLLDVLRTDAEPAADLSPQPGLAGIGNLVEQVRDAGLAAALSVEGEPGPLDPGVSLTVYRIVQEALTNALKHAGPATVEVRLRFGVYWLTVEVCDTGRGPAPGGGAIGHGLVGMRERVALYRGTLRTGPRPGGGFRVYARIPVEHLGHPTGEGAVP